MKTRIRRAVALAALTLVSLSTYAPVASPAAAAERRVFADGHVDMGPRVTGGSWKLQVRDDTASPPVWRDFDAVVLHATAAAKITVPEGDTYGFLGTAGDSVYVLPQVQRGGIVWPGWNTQDPTVVDGVTGDVTWTVRKVDGPGEFNLFLSDSFGSPSMVFDGGKSFPQSTTIKPNTHAHGNWAFSKAGIYRLQMSMSGTSTSGSALTDTRTLVLAVDTDPGRAPAGGLPGDGSGGGNGDGSGNGGDDGNGGGANGGGAGSGSDDGGSGSLPNTGGGLLLPIAGGAALLLLAGVTLRLVGRNRPARDSTGDPA